VNATVTHAFDVPNYEQGKMGTRLDDTGFGKNTPREKEVPGEAGAREKSLSGWTLGKGRGIRELGASNPIWQSKGCQKTT